jgi:uncharacterized membrane protein YcjF (UPF0283 family)
MSKLITRHEQEQMGLIRPSASQAPAFVPADKIQVLPSRHEIIDPYANAPALEAVQMVSHHTYTPQSRAWSMLIKTTAVTVALAILTMAAMYMLDSWTFLAWLLLASLEWCAVFVWLALLDFRETPAAHVRQKTDGYLDLMRREQRARLKALYGYEED